MTNEKASKGSQGRDKAPGQQKTVTLVAREGFPQAGQTWSGTKAEYHNEKAALQAQGYFLDDADAAEDAEEPVEGEDGGTGS